ncbi:MAG: glycogen debranching enzyme N-terminal domain-containing protein [Verrucomicrobia bacterium]|nr:glycogen debranching enzyme N-terminal domain-containing protein [Verrucomicrobiota bacterium]
MLRLIMTPAPTERILRFVGDRVRFSVRTAEGAPLPSGWRVLLRTNLGRAHALRQEIIHSYPAKPALADAAWHDIPLLQAGAEWSREIALVETGYFRAKAYAADPHGRQHWVEGADVGVSIHPDACRTGNTIYCAFVRMFGPTKTARTTADAKLEAQLAELDQRHYTVIPPAGKLRDLVREFPHVFDTLGCRILHLLPVTPTPTVFARFGRFGSPYAVQDLTAIDPALVEFDKRTTGLDQFCELTYEAHRRGGRVFLDIVINHTGWGATLQEQHPEWYLRDERGNFVSPGAWGTTWEDLVELNHKHPELWQDLAEVFLTWCRRGVDGFRCDAGYKIPVEVWRYITARVLEEFPETIFLLEGLGGKWEDTEALLTDGSMQWAYSELFQNYSGGQVAWYLDYALRQSQRVGLYVHYSETHDNNRLAEKGRVWSLLRNRLCALASASGGFGFTCGVEWLAAEKVNVHASRGLSWGQPDNIVPELAQLNRLLREHPCFWDGAKLTRLSAPDSPVFALRREAGEGGAAVVVLVNTDVERQHSQPLPQAKLGEADLGGVKNDLLGQALPKWHRVAGEQIEFVLPAGAAFCIEAGPAKLPVPPYARPRAQAAWAVQALSAILPPEEIGAFDWRWLAAWVDECPARFLGVSTVLDRSLVQQDLRAALERAVAAHPFPQVVAWRVADRRRITLVPQRHWLLIEDSAPFRATLNFADGATKHVQSIAVRAGHIASFAPGAAAGDATLTLERYAAELPRVEAVVRFLPPDDVSLSCNGYDRMPTRESDQRVVLLTNGRGGMARLRVDLGRIVSKYDCLLGANLHPSVPVDRHVFAKRARVWINADGFITPLNADNLVAFEAGPPARWRFVANAGDGRAVEIQLAAEMAPDQNTTVLRFHRPATPPRMGRPLPDECEASLTVRVDIEDRNFHSETHRNGGAEHHFASNCHPLPSRAGLLSAKDQSVGFAFTPAADRQLRVLCDRGAYHHEAEWCEHVPHPFEATRGQVAEGDAYSPGWFQIPLGKGDSVTLVVTAEGEVQSSKFKVQGSSLEQATDTGDALGDRLAKAVKAYVVRRDQGKTVIAGYPWFLDWGRDTLIAARGLLAAGMVDEVAALLKVFGRFEENGTLPNAIYGDNASNRDTSDAPLWFGVVCEEISNLKSQISNSPKIGAEFLATPVNEKRRPLSDVLRSIAVNNMRGTPNGIRMDPASALLWSPSHFTWMDTNHPAGTPREGYPVEIQALWIRLLRLLDTLGLPAEKETWRALAERAEESLAKLFWLEDRGWLADVLIAKAGTPAQLATPRDALRPNCLFAVAFGFLTGEQARRCVEAAQQHLLVPGALRSLAPLPVRPPLPVHAADGRLLNDPAHPYWGRYEGDEDTRRKPAYHNGTAWGWPFPVFCEALARAWDWQPAAVAAARSYLCSVEQLMRQGCLGQLPEILDGDAPHTLRGCDAQAWSVTEALRVWRLLEGKREAGNGIRNA